MAAHPLIHLIAKMVVRWRQRQYDTRRVVPSQVEGPPKPMPTPVRDNRSAAEPLGAGMKEYLKEAFFFRWNLLFFLGGLAGAAMTPMAEVMMPLVTAVEMSYLAGLLSIPRFRAAIDAKVHAARRAGGAEPAATTAAPSLVSLLEGLPADARQRFERLHTRCVDMRAIAVGVRGAAGSDSGSAEEIRTPGLDRLLWLFLRLLMSKAALGRFLDTMRNEDIATRLEQLRKDLATAQTAGDERIVKSLQDSIAMSELRLDNYERAKKNAQFVSIELDRIEGKIQALAEMTVNRQDPDFLSSQVDSAAESMRQTEKAVSELQHLTGLADELQEPPAILESDLRQVLRHDA
jgi:phage terminase Nu1 subunit (DNA packaging protein)